VIYTVPHIVSELSHRGYEKIENKINYFDSFIVVTMAIAQACVRKPNAKRLKKYRAEGR